MTIKPKTETITIIERKKRERLKEYCRAWIISFLIAPVVIFLLILLMKEAK